ncbi:MAG: hypothetical protein H0U73_01370, partial [Tatlockia sp.]|nr:hypothetical protein [Tatlockia sp.]
MESTRLRDTTIARDSYTWPKISWSAIFSGALIGLGLGFLLQLFGIAIGLSAYHSTSAG